MDYFKMLGDALTEHRNKAVISCDEHCFCWEVDIILGKIIDAAKGDNLTETTFENAKVGDRR